MLQLVAETMIYDGSCYATLYLACPARLYDMNVDSKKLEHGRIMICVDCPCSLGLGVGGRPWSCGEFPAATATLYTASCPAKPATQPKNHHGPSPAHFQLPLACSSGVSNEP